LAAFLLFKQHLVQMKSRGIMISGAPVGTPYFNHMASMLGVKDAFESLWINSRIAALEGPGETEPSPFLLLDEFNSCDNANISFLDAFMRRRQEEKLYLIIMTQNKEMAKQLCNLNGEWLAEDCPSPKLS
jgi:hypothetical protein